MKKTKTIVENNTEIYLTKNAEVTLRKLTKENIDGASIGIIYMHTCRENGKSYIGQTIKGMVTSRWGKRGLHYLSNSSSSKFASAIRKYSWDNFDHYILGFYITNNLDRMEKFWISKFDTYANGYNSTIGGKLIDMSGKKHREETKRKIGLSNGKGVVRFVNIEDNKYQYDKLYSTIADAAKDVGVYNNGSIVACCKGKRKTIKSFMWRYADECKPGDIIENIKCSTASYSMLGKKHNDISIKRIRDANTLKFGKIIEQLDMDGHLICEYPSLNEATRSIGASSHGGISNCCRGKAKSAYGYKWRYKSNGE